MNLGLLIFLAIASYAVASLLQVMYLGAGHRFIRRGVLLTGAIAVCLHAVLLHQWIDVAAGQNLSVSNLFSLFAWLVAVLIILVAIARPVDILILAVFPLAMVSMLFVWYFPGDYIIKTMANPKMLFHILLAIFTFCVLGVAGFMAVLLAMQEYCLRHRRVTQLLSRVPPLETMELLLFQLISLGFLLLSIVLATSVYFYSAAVLQQGILLQKTILVSVAWLIFAVLLFGRYYWGWRGRTAIYCTLSAVALLVVVYFGSQLMMEAFNQ